MKTREKIVTFLGNDTEFDGKLTFPGTTRMEGIFKGEISSDGSLIVGEKAMLEANIHVSYIIITGEIRGEIIADKRIDIREPGKVYGNIQAPTVVMGEGAIFEGTCKMSQAEKRNGKLSIK